MRARVCLCSLTGNCLIRSSFSSTACAPNAPPYVWSSSTWRTAACPSTCEPGRAVCRRTPCWWCAWTSARGWITLKAPTSSTEIWYRTDDQTSHPVQQMKICLGSNRWKSQWRKRREGLDKHLVCQIQGWRWSWDRCCVSFSYRGATLDKLD